MIFSHNSSSLGLLKCEVPDNKLPDCVFLKLEAALGNLKGNVNVLQYLTGKVKTRDVINLKLTINFNEQWEELPGGRVRFGLTSGELRLGIHNGRVAYGSRTLNDNLETVLNISRVEKNAVVSKQGITFGTDKQGTTGNLTKSLDRTVETTDTFQVRSYQVTTKGSEEDPVWDFAVKTSDPVLKGTLIQENLALVDILQRPCYIKATFETSIRHIFITDVEGFWSGKISREKRIVLDKLIILSLLKPKLKPYISKQEIQYE
ncbi:hypothetical protein ACN4EK_29000 [Pantanalinema rosaneae CENA516]|uniref:hypothetical protein n=1 Tax=Pantanalinema rosaneae TaxID=1620701 RepID=UPI003D6FC2F0